MTLFPKLIAIFCDSLTHIQCKWLGFGCFCIFSSLSRDRLGSFDWCIVGYYMRLLAFICFALYTVGDWWMRISHTQHFLNLCAHSNWIDAMMCMRSKFATTGEIKIGTHKKRMFSHFIQHRMRLFLYKPRIWSFLMKWVSQWRPTFGIN